MPCGGVAEVVADDPHALDGGGLSDGADSAHLVEDDPPELLAGFGAGLVGQDKNPSERSVVAGRLLAELTATLEPSAVREAQVLELGKKTMPCPTYPGAPGDFGLVLGVRW